MINPTKRSRLVAWMVLTGAAQAAAAQAMDESRPRPATATSPSQAPVSAPADLAASPKGYYRMPAIAGDRLLFCAEGDLWSVPLAGGRASRLTSHPGEERLPVVSPDALTVAFTGEYEGPAEVYTMPVAGGRPTRRTYYGGRTAPVAWDGPNRLIVATPRHSTLPNLQLVALTIDGERTPGAAVLPLAQAAEASFDGRGTLFFTRLDFQGSHTRRYSGGTAQNLWRLDPPAPGGELQEAVPLTAGYDGTSASPMFFDGRLYFRSDRSEGAAPPDSRPAPAAGMNIWSMRPDGTDLRRHTRHDDFEVRSPSLGVPGASGAGRGRIAYQLGADIWVLDLAADAAAPVEIRLETDLDQTRERWIDKPMTYVTSARLSPDGGHVAITARGEVFVAPRKFGRLVEVTRKDGVRYRDARFLPGAPGAEPPDLASSRLVALSDESGEVELWTLPANGVGDNAQLTSDGEVLRWEAAPSPDGKRIAHHDKNLRLWIYDVEKKAGTKIDENTIEGFTDLRWSPDGRWLAYAAWCSNLNMQLKLYDAESGAVTILTSDRTSSVSPAWHPGGEFIYFLSERNLESLVSSPWGTLQPEPFFDKRMKVFAIALKSGLPSPFEEPNELTPKDDSEDAIADDKPEPKPGEPAKDGSSKDEAKPDDGATAGKETKEKKKAEVKPIVIELNGLTDRVYATPVPPGNYAGLSVNDKALFFASAQTAPGEPKTALQAFAIDGEAMKKREWKVETLLDEIKGYELSHDGASLLIQTETALAIVDAAPAKIEDLSKSALKLDGWKLSVRPREEWRQMYREAWRLHRDYFYDRGMHGVDWRAMKARYEPLVDRVASRGDLSDVLAQLIAELSALHHFVVGGDLRQGPEKIGVATLGATLARDEKAGGFRIEKIFDSDPDRPELVSPLARPGLDIRAGDVITMIDGAPAIEAPDVSALLRNKAGRQVLLHTVRPGGGEPRPSIVTPAGMETDRELRYRQWQLERRRMVEELGRGEIGYIHLRAMGAGDIADFARQYYPVFTRKGLIIDVRHNGGGNIDSWVLSRLMRKAWFFWQGRIGEPTWNMQFAFRGHMVALCNEETASDGEAFSEGFRRLGLGKVIGTRTWGGEIWLSFSNYLVDKGIASAAEIGVYGPEGAWLIEGRGVEPDIIVDNLPVATARGEDAQLKAAIEHLQQRIREQPVTVPPPPRHPDKSWRPARP